MLNYIYIDESGDLGTQSKYLVLAALLVANPAELDRIIKNMRRHKFSKQLRKAQEIKANNSKPEVIKHMLEKLNAVPRARVFYMVLEKRKLHSEYLKCNKHKLYNYVAGKLARNININSVNLEIRIDRSKGKQLLQEDFNQYFRSNLSDFPKVEIYHSYSHGWSGLQFADILAWSAFQKFEHQNPEFVDMLEIEQEVFHVW